MASRPVFVPKFDPKHLVEEVMVDFVWHPGMAPSQKKKNIAALHEAASSIGLTPLLEVSTKSEVQLGQRLSAFSLQLITPDFSKIYLEAAFQGSKVFQDKSHYPEIYYFDSLSAKKDPRTKDKKLYHFDYFGDIWPLVPKTAFYDWLYLSALRPHKEYLKRLFYFKGFTDIEFNPEKSINCQARTCALLVSLLHLNLFDYAMSSKENFINTVYCDSLKKSHSNDLLQTSFDI